MVDSEPGSFRFAGGYATGGRLPDFNGLHWIGDESDGRFEDDDGKPIEWNQILESLNVPSSLR